MAKPPATVALNLRRRFALASLGVIVVIALGLGWLMSHILTQRMLQREGEVSMDFIQNLLKTDQSGHYLLDPANEQLKARFLASMAHVSSMSEPVRANAYQVDGMLVWSTDAALMGRRYTGNDELDEALSGKLVVKSGRLDGSSPGKGEHLGLAQRTNYYVESYIPVMDEDKHTVLGVLELYKIPLQLNAALHDALIQLWLACLASALGLFGSLYWMVVRADRFMARQQALLTESQALAAAVELGGAVAHNLRNPLASIRISAEMLQAGDASPQDIADYCSDITTSVDRADRWITELLRVSQGASPHPELVLPSQVLLACLHEMAPEMDRRGIRWSMSSEVAPAVLAHTAMLRQLLISVIANAIDAMPDGGDLTIAWRTTAKQLRLQILDSGTGMSEDTKNALFRPFFSTKSGGLGLGLALVRRMVAQWGGEVILKRGPVKGTCVELVLPLASAVIQGRK